MSTSICRCGLCRAIILSLLLINWTAITSAAELLVADRATNRILAFDEQTGAFVRVVTDQLLDGPSGMTLGPGGWLYVSNVQAYPGGAASVIQVNPETGATVSFITDVIAPGGIAYDGTTDTLFVSEFGNFDGNEVFRYDASGSLVQTIGTGSAPTGRAGMAFDAAGNLYVAESNFFGYSSSVIQYTVGSGYAVSSTFASGSQVSPVLPIWPVSGFNGLAFDSAGDLYAASMLGQMVAKYEISGGTVVGASRFGTPLPYASGLAFDSDGDLLVSYLGNDNPADPFWGNNLFPGEIARFNAVTGAATPFLVGDCNHDAVVDDSDLAKIQASYGVDAAGDLDGDADTDGADFLLWQRSFGNVGISGPFQPTAIVRYEPILVTAAAVPEPATWLSVALLTGCVVMLRSRFPE